MDSSNEDIFRYYVRQNANKSSKKQLITILRIEGQFYMPPSRNISSRYLRSVFSGNKLIFKVEEV